MVRFAVVAITLCALAAYIVAGPEVPHPKPRAVVAPPPPSPVKGLLYGRPDPRLN